MDRLSLDFILRYGTQAQLDALKSFGESASNTKQLSQGFDPSKLQGDIDTFTHSELNEVLDMNELLNAFKIIDADGDGNISAEEAQNFAMVGNDENDSEIDDSDINSLIESGKMFFIS